MSRLLWFIALVGISAFAMGLNFSEAHASDYQSPLVVDTISVGNTPYGIAVTPDGSKVFVSNSAGGSISVIDTASRAVSSTIMSNVGSTPVGIAINPSGTTAYVGNYNNGTITAIDVASLTTTSHDIRTATSSSCTWILNLAVAKDGSKLFLACQDDSVVQSLDLPTLATGSLLASTGNNCFPTDVAVSGDSITIVVAVNGPSTGSFPCANPNVALFVTTSNAPAGNSTLPATNGAFSVAISPSTGLAYLAGRDSGAISIVNPATRSNAGADLVVGGVLSDIAITPDGTQAAVSVVDRSEVVFIDLASGEIAHTVAVGDGPQSITISRDGRFLYTANRNSNDVSVVQLPVPPLFGDNVPTAPMQQFGRAELARCTSQPIDLADFPGLGESARDYGWSMSWAQWPNGGTGGFVCTRQPYYTSTGQWSVG
jgi:YVTN family beta-propeller protein